MKNNRFILNNIIYVVLSVFIVLLLVVLSKTSVLLKSRANDAHINVIINLQGKRVLGATMNAKVEIYSNTGLVSQDTVRFEYKSTGLFHGSVAVPSASETSNYALFIKPEKYIGQLFCSENITGPNCKTPAFSFKNGTNVINLRENTFYAGDIAPADGKVNAQDLSLVLSKLGEKNSFETDINNDFVTNSIDYSLVLQSIAKNLQDDTLFAFASPIPTAEPTEVLEPSATPEPTSVPTPTDIAQTTPTTPLPTPTGTPKPTTKPTPTALPTPKPTQKPTPTPKPAPSSGKCITHVTGKVYINAPLIGKQCRILDETSYYCVSTENECTVSKCIQVTKDAIKASTNSCSNGLASFDESSPISCSVTFEATSSCQNPPPRTSCDDDRAECN
jgi:cell division septation protein DedD